MSRSGRKLTEQEAELWARVANTVAPIEDRPVNSIPREGGESPKGSAKAKQSVHRPASKVARHSPALPPQARSSDLGKAGLDSSWDRKLSRGTVLPDFTLDLHGASLDAAHGRLIHGLSQAKALGARVILLVTGKPRPVEAADRGQRRGAIRAKVIDWLAHSEHAADIAAIRNAHPRHGGQGALYIVLRKRRT